MKTKNKCEACNRKLDNLETLGSRDATYFLCPTCLIFLVTHKLSKKHFFNLIKNGHSSNEFHLHDDFYDYE